MTTLQPLPRDPLYPHARLGYGRVVSELPEPLGPLSRRWPHRCGLRARIRRRANTCCLVAIENGDIPISPLLVEFDLGMAFMDRVAPQPN